MSKTVKNQLIKVASLLLVWGLAGYGLKMLNKSLQTTTAIESSTSTDVVSNESHTASPDEVPFKTKSNTVRVRINPILGEKKQ